MTPELRDWRDERDWLRPWREKPGLICCCVGASKLIVVVSFGRHLYAYDGSGAQVWTYDLGQSAALNDYHGGKPLIDSAGNTYIVEKESVVNKADTNLLKIDKTGALVWTYAVGNTFSVYSATGRELCCATCFDSSGNIVFGTGIKNALVDSSWNYAYKVSTSGTLLQSYSTHNTGFGAFADGAEFGGANMSVIEALALDSSDNVYWIEPSNHNRLFKVNSSGTFQSSVTINGLNSTASQEFGRSMCADTTNNKLFIGFSVNPNSGTGVYDTAAYLAGKWDCAGMSNDWVFDLTHWNTTIIDLTNSDFKQVSGLSHFTGRGISYNPNTLKVYCAGGYMLNNLTGPGEPLPIEQFFSMNSGTLVAIGWSSLVQNSANSGHGGAITCDPTTGDVFGIFDSSGGGVPVNALWRLDSSNGTAIWNVNSTASPFTVGCGSYT